MYSYKIKITAGLTSIREVAALFSPTRIIFKLNKDTLFYQIMVYYKNNYSKLNLY